MACGVLMLVHASMRSRAELPRLREKTEMVKRFGLTDLCLFTEASYTRHPSQADFHTPFQNHPVALEHFPSGSILAPPPHLKMRSVRESVSDSKNLKTLTGTDTNAETDHVD